MSEEKGLATKAIHSFDREEWSWNPVVLPIVSSITYKYREEGKPLDFSYIRCGSPTVAALQNSIACLEDAKYGLCYPSGMASLVAIVQLLRPGDHIICSEFVYNGTRQYLQNYAANMDIEISVINCLNTSLLEKSIKDNTKYVIVESLSNPTLHILEIEVISKVTSKHKDTLLVVDNTLLTPVFFKPLNFGADIVYHSLTKYMNGHGDVLMGAVVTNNETVYNNLKMFQIDLGSNPSPFDCYLVHRGLKTLKVRMLEHAKNAEAIAKFLEGHEKVEKVLYPGLPSHPEHDLAKKQFKGYSGMVAFYLKGGRTAIDNLRKSLKVFTISGSFGLTESIASHPWTVSHATLHENEKIRLGITENLMRLSIGLEDENDLIVDLKQALESI